MRGTCLIHALHSPKKKGMISTKEPKGASSNSPSTRGKYVSKSENPMQNVKYVSKSENPMQNEDRSGNNVLSGRLAFAQSSNDSIGKCSLMTP